MLPLAYRLRGYKDFKRLFKVGRSSYSSHFKLIWRPNRLPVSRLGLIISSKQLKRAVDRNLLRRRIKAWWFQNYAQSTAVSKDIVLILKRSAFKLSYLQLAQQLEQAFLKIDRSSGRDQVKKFR